MATIETKTTEVRCDRCDKRIVKPRDPVALTPTGVTDTPDDIPLDLCKPCEDSLRKWWTRWSKGAE